MQATLEDSIVTRQAQLNLVVVYASDLARAKSFYETLGLRFTQERHGGPEHYSCHIESTVFEIYPRNGREVGAPAVRIGFRVASVDETLERLTRQGASLVTPAKDSPWGRRAVVKDPDGYIVELSSQQSA
jgi:predicted enzyme related to lactoylglutathione lyase